MSECTVPGKIPSVAPLAAQLRMPLYRNGYALMLSTGMVSALGMAYWVLAAHHYSAEAVGLNAAAISAMTFVSGIAQFNMGGALLLFVLATMVWGIFAQQDNVLTGLRQAVFVPLENVLYALAKIGLLLALAPA